MKIWWIPVMVLTIATAGCSGGQKEAKEPSQAESQAPRHEETPPPVQQAKPVETPAPSGPVETSPVAKPAESHSTPQPGSTAPLTKVVTLPSGYSFETSLEQKISTETHHAGTAFEARLVKPAVLKTDGEIIPAGSKIRGEVTFAKRAERVGGKADLTLEFRELTTPDGKSYPLFTEPLVLEGKGTAKGDIEKTVGGAVGGAIIGGILGGKSGAVKGGVAGGAAGATWAVATRGNDIVLDTNQVLAVTLTRALRVTTTVHPGSTLP
jgi:hypothetical protein